MEQQVSAMVKNTANIASETLETAKELITSFHDSAAAQVRDKWWDFFFEMAGKYRDVYIITDPHAKDFTTAYKYLSISK